MIRITFKDGQTAEYPGGVTLALQGDTSTVIQDAEGVTIAELQNDDIQATESVPDDPIETL